MHKRPVICSRHRRHGGEGAGTTWTGSTSSSATRPSWPSTIRVRRQHARAVGAAAGRDPADLHDGRAHRQPGTDLRRADRSPRRARGSASQAIAGTRRMIDALRRLFGAWPRLGPAAAPAERLAAAGREPAGRARGSACALGARIGRRPGRGCTTARGGRRWTPPAQCRSDGASRRLGCRASDCAGAERLIRAGRTAVLEDLGEPGGCGAGHEPACCFAIACAKPLPAADVDQLDVPGRVIVVDAIMAIDERSFWVLRLVPRRRPRLTTARDRVAGGPARAACSTAPTATRAPTSRRRTPPPASARPADHGFTPAISSCRHRSPL